MSELEPEPELELAPLREVIEMYGLSAKKSFGQNFLLDINLTRKIARIAGDLDNSHIYEIGPGPGGLTRALLLEGAAYVTAVEMDRRCIPALEDLQAAFPGRLTLIQGDALEINEAEILSQTDYPKKIVANLPYNVGTQLFVKWLTEKDWLPWYQSLTLMFQKEVAERIVAKPGTKAYGRLSVLAQWRGKARIAYHVPARAFTPPPKVDSAIIHFEPTEPIDAELSLKNLELVVAQAFSQRRKMLRASLKSLNVEPLDLLDKAGIDPTTRADALSVEDYVRLAKIYQQMTP